MAVSNVKKSMTRFSIDDILDDSKASVKKKEEDASQTLISLDARENYLRNVLDFQIIDKKRLCYTDPPLLEESHTLKERRIYNELALKLDLQHSSMTSYYSDFRASKPDLCSYRDCTLFCRQQQQLSSSVASQNNDFERSYSTANNRHFPPSPTSSVANHRQQQCILADNPLKIETCHTITRHVVVSFSRHLRQLPSVIHMTSSRVIHRVIQLHQLQQFHRRSDIRHLFHPTNHRQTRRR